MTRNIVPFALLTTADLIVDAVYAGGSHGDVRDDPISPLVGGGNQGGFRYLGSPSSFDMRHCVLYSELNNPDWPDRIDLETGAFTYYGDNRTYGMDLHDTTRQGNTFLREAFHRLHLRHRDAIPPVFVFTKAGNARDVVFRGLAVPGAPGVSENDDLVAVWRTKEGNRFQNYRAIFTVLDVPRIERAWINRLKAGEHSEAGAPLPWLRWRATGVYSALTAPRTRAHRTPAEQIPRDTGDLQVLQQVVSYYDSHPDGKYAFERCAGELFRLMDPNVRSIDLTRPWRDGGRDALGEYSVGTAPSAITVEFALEAKCKKPAPDNSSGVHETARLVARIRHRQFGVFVTTSCVGEQAYKELVEDAHPIVIVSGIDIVDILKDHGVATPEGLDAWLRGLEGR